MANIIAGFKKLSTTKKVVIISAVVFGLAVGSYFIFRKKKPAKPLGGPTANGTALTGPPPGMPSMSVNRDTGATDDYSVTMAGQVFFYTKGDAPVTGTIDNTWSVTMATAQDNTNNLLVSVLKDGNIVYTQKYL